MLLFEQKPGRLEGMEIPAHIGIIMDGNGRWAKKRGLPRSAGHKFGAEAFKKIVTYARDIGVQYLTVYAFSTENWKRPQEEIDNICSLLHQYIREAMGSLGKENIRMQFIGDVTAFDPALQQEIREIEEESRTNDGLHLNIGLNYGGRDELVHAFQTMAQLVKNGQLSPEQIDEDKIQSYLYTAGQPDPDLIIRPSGEFRLSNFLMWQSAYSELWFSNILWPDFKPADLDQAIIDYNSRSRRFGGI
ncbi:MAG: isoprenyl transferase [Eubacteriales bacterium]|jgi:undecaprenyl diphosphate synthase